MDGNAPISLFSTSSFNNKRLHDEEALLLDANNGSDTVVQSRTGRATELCAGYGTKIYNTLKDVGSHAWNNKLATTGVALGTALMTVGGVFASNLEAPGVDDNSVPGAAFMEGVGLGVAGLGLCMLAVLAPRISARREEAAARVDAEQQAGAPHERGHSGDHENQID